MDHYYVEECPICRQGALIIVRAKDSNKLLVMCDDCESQWSTPEQAIAGDEPLSQEVFNVEDASFAEIEDQGWKEYVKNK